jgi:soluble lytic murein transglycosylase-like protein
MSVANTLKSTPKLPKSVDDAKPEEKKAEAKPVIDASKPVEAAKASETKKADGASKVSKTGGAKAVAAPKKYLDLSATIERVRGAIQKLIPPSPPPDAIAEKEKAAAKEKLALMASSAVTTNGGKRPQGWCGRAFKDLVEKFQLPGAAIPRQPEARMYADFLNTGDNAKKVGLKRLNIDNPYEAPAGAIVVVAPHTPGTSHPTAGDITIAAGNGRFINDGEMNYHGSANFPPGNTHVLGIYVPTGADGATFDIAKQLSASHINQVNTHLNPAESAKVLPVMQDAMRAAGIDTPKRAAAFTAAMARGSLEMRDLDYVVKATQVWKANNLNTKADTGDIRTIYNTLTNALKTEGSSPAALARPADDDLTIAMEHGPAPATFDEDIKKAAAKFGVPARLLKSMMKQESGFKLGSQSPVGAQGLLQLMPGTYREMQQKYGIDGPASDPTSNIMAGAAYMGEQLRAFHGNVGLALAAYNAGPGAVRAHNSVPPFRETQDYVRKITADYGGVVSGSDAYYQKALDAFGIAEPSPYASTGHNAHRSYVSRSRVRPRDTYADINNRQTLAAMHSSDSYFDLSFYIMQLLLPWLTNPEERDKLIAALCGNPEFIKFVQSHQGMENWTPEQLKDKPLDDRMLVEFVGTKLTEVTGVNEQALGHGKVDFNTLSGTPLYDALARGLPVFEKQLKDGTLPQSPPQDAQPILASN